MIKSGIRKELRETYFRFLIPSIVLLVIFYIIKFLGLIGDIQIESLHLISILLFVLAAVFSIALPIFYRTLFVSKLKNVKTISISEFIGFEKRLIIISMITPYIIIIPLTFNFTDFYFGGIILFALYAVYYFYPSKKRIEFEKKLFRIKEETK